MSSMSGHTTCHLPSTQDPTKHPIEGAGCTPQSSAEIRGTVNVKVMATIKKRIEPPKYLSEEAWLQFGRITARYGAAENFLGVGNNIKRLMQRIYFFLRIFLVYKELIVKEN